MAVVRDGRRHLTPCCVLFLFSPHLCPTTAQLCFSGGKSTGKFVLTHQTPSWRSQNKNTGDGWIERKPEEEEMTKVLLVSEPFYLIHNQAQAFPSSPSPQETAHIAHQLRKTCELNTKSYRSFSSSSPMEKPCCMAGTHCFPSTSISTSVKELNGKQVIIPEHSVGCLLLSC